MGILVSFRIYNKIIKDFECYFNYYVCYGIVEEGIFFVLRLLGDLSFFFCFFYRVFCWMVFVGYVMSIIFSFCMVCLVDVFFCLFFNMNMLIGINRGFERRFGRKE